MPLPSALEARVAELERERKHLLAIIEILKEVSTSLHFIDILQGIARKLGEAFGLDRCSIFLAERGGRSVRLVASYEDPTIRNYVVDLERYPELKRAMQGGETVFIPDAASDPSLRHVKNELVNRNVKSITVVPITWRGVAIGAIFLRTFRDGPTFSDEDVRFLRPRPARAVGRRVRPPVSRAAAARGGAPRAARSRQPHPTHWRTAGAGVPQAPAPRPHAVAGQRLRRGRAGRVGGPQQPAVARGPDGGLHARSEDRRRRRQPH